MQGFSGIKRMADGSYLTLSDNGFGTRANSLDAILMFHRLGIDWATGMVSRRETVFLRDPDKVIPFLVVNEGTRERYVTGADLDVESIQPIWGGALFRRRVRTVSRAHRPDRQGHRLLGDDLRRQGPEVA